MTAMLGKLFLAALALSYCLLLASADPIPEQAESGDAKPLADTPVHTKIGGEDAVKDGIHQPVGCSSNPREENPCGMTQHQGVFSWVSDTRKYEWIYMAFCLTLGACIFLFVISAAIYNASTYKKKQQRLLAHINEEDERARAATIHTGERRGSHLAQPRRSSLSVAIQDPASSKR